MMSMPPEKKKLLGRMSLSTLELIALCNNAWCLLSTVIRFEFNMRLEKCDLISAKLDVNNWKHINHFCSEVGAARRQVL